MNLEQKRSKGLSLTMNTFLWGMMILIAIVFIFWFFISRYISVQDSVIDETSERYLNDLLSDILSSPDYAYIDSDNRTYRDVIDVNKLNDGAIYKDNYNKNIVLCTSDLGYPNSMYIVEFLDLENENGWINFFVSNNFDLKYRDNLNEFFECVKDKIKDNLDKVFTWDSKSNSINQPICDFRFINDCLEDRSAYYYGGFPSTKGLPVALIYDDGEKHVGRILGCLIVFGYNPANAIENFNLHGAG